jgi:hypothetical protein
LVQPARPGRVIVSVPSLGVGYHYRPTARFRT